METGFVTALYESYSRGVTPPPPYEGFSSNVINRLLLSHLPLHNATLVH